MTSRWKAFAKRWGRRLGVFVLGVLAVLLLIVPTGLAERWARGAIVGRLEQMTGGRVELQAFRFRFFALRAELDGLTIHGREPEGTPPFFQAERLVVDIRVVSLFRRKIALDEVRLERPAVHVRIDAEGRSNVPAPPPRQPGRPWRERLFELAIRELRIRDGEMFFNHVRVPLVAEGGEFGFALALEAPAAGKESYWGEFRWQQVELAARRYIPFRSDLEAKFTLSRGAFELREFRWKLPQSEFRAGARLASFVQPAWSFRYQGTLDLADLRAILRKPNTPGGVVEFSGEGQYAAKQVTARGHYLARDIAMPYQWFHTSGVESRGSYRVENRRLEVPDFQARALGGVIQGKVEFNFRELQFRVESRARGMSLAAVLAAVDNPDFPLATLHWNGGVDVDSVTTWTADFKQVESRGQSLWSPPDEHRAGEIPATARLDYHYAMDRRAVDLRASQISTPTSRLEFNGRLGALDSGLEVKLEAQDLLPWNDFINRLRGREAEPRRIAGRAAWRGRVLGPLERPTFAGHVKASQAAYDRLNWDEVEGDLTYSPQQFRFDQARARRGNSSAEVELWLELDDWSFRRGCAWSFEANLVRAGTDELQALFDTAYPARGLLTGQFRGRGTRGDPELAGLFDVSEAEAWGYQLDRVRGQLSLRRDELRISNAEIRKAGGRVTGNFLYRQPEQEVAFDLTGAVIPIERIERWQSERLPLGGQLSFQVRGSGPLRAPTAQGTLRLVNLRVGQDVLGSFEGRLEADGQRMRVEMNSAMAAGRLAGQLDVTLGGDYPLRGDLTVEGLDLDAFIETAFRLHLTGNSNVNGRFRVSGALARPETLAVEADVSQIRFDYQQLKLENVGPLRVVYRQEEVRIEQARIRGPDTDFVLTGFLRFAGDRRINLNLGGTVNLQLLGGFLPELEARGAAQVNAAVEGTLSSPHVTGRLQVENAAASYGDFPAGLSQLTGELVFDRSRLVFENVAAEAGGGRLVLGGTVTYGDGPLRYDMTAQATRVRIRYPEGMSWLAGGTLRLSGTTRAGLLSGRVVVERLLMSQGFDIATLILASREAPRGPTAASPYLRNLQLDIEATSSPDARVEWSAARFESEASLRVRGTWEHPVLLGHIHLLSGEMSFRGNRYRLTRGDINFSNPFRLDPVLNVEATTTIRQYEVTLNFTGPASRLTLAYRSDPPLPSSDIITLLALGRTGEESELRTSATGQVPEAGASTLLSEAISSQVGGRIERLFGVSRFRVDPFLAGTGSEPNASARITIEQQVTRELTITYISNVTSTQQQVIQVEYAVNRDVSLILLRDQNGTFGLDVKLKKRFK